MRIKTIRQGLGGGTPGEVKEFDQKVNAALSEGFELIRRYITPAYTTSNRDFYPCLIAELEKPDAPVPEEPMDANRAIRVLREACRQTEGCDVCLLAGWCHEFRGSIPSEWPLR